jgi:hypothetical protein
VCQEVGELSSVWHECEYECEFEMRRDEMNELVKYELVKYELVKYELVKYELVKYEVWKQEEKLRRIWL